MTDRTGTGSSGPSDLHEDKLEGNDCIVTFTTTLIRSTGNLKLLPMLLLLPIVTHFPQYCDNNNNSYVALYPVKNYELAALSMRSITISMLLLLPLFDSPCSPNVKIAAYATIIAII